MLILLPFFKVEAEEVPPSPVAKTALVINAPALQQDDVVWAGVTFRLPPEWHIYWQNPGDSGIPTSFTWTLPKGITAGEIVWPAPEHIETSGLVNYGYSGEVTLPVPLTVLRGNAKGTATVTAKWLACRDICIPESAVLSAPLPSRTKDASAILEAAVMRAPRSLTVTQAIYGGTERDVILTLEGGELFAGTPAITKAVFFPLEDGIIANAEPQLFRMGNKNTALALTMKRGSAALPALWHGVIEVTRGEEVANYAVTATRATPVARPPLPQAPAVPQTPLFLALLLAFLGGLILNVMPCVLPILALKALAIAKKASVSRRAAARQGLAYTAGVVLSFLLIAGFMLVLRASGAAIGWGFQLQHSSFVLLLALVMLFVAANLLGLFELPVLFGRQASVADEDTRGGAFATGILAVLVATPCTAPFMTTALGATLTLRPLPALLIFLMLGLGMAAPFLLISFWPAARALLPKPGRWMVRFKQILALPMLATALWLFWVLVQLNTIHTPTANSASMPFSTERLEELRQQGKPVLVDATAAWCLTCKVNERVALEPAAMQRFFAEKNVAVMVADWTGNDAAITAYLASFGRSGVPLYVYYPPHAAPRVLPQLLTPSLVREAIGPASE